MSVTKMFSDALAQKRVKLAEKSFLFSKNLVLNSKPVIDIPGIDSHGRHYLDDLIK